MRDTPDASIPVPLPLMVLAIGKLGQYQWNSALCFSFRLCFPILALLLTSILTQVLPSPSRCPYHRGDCSGLSGRFRSPLWRIQEKLSSYSHFCGSPTLPLSLCTTPKNWSGGRLSQKWKKKSNPGSSSQARSNAKTFELSQSSKLNNAIFNSLPTTHHCGNAARRQICSPELWRPPEGGVS